MEARGSPLANSGDTDVFWKQQMTKSHGHILVPSLHPPADDFAKAQDLVPKDREQRKIMQRLNDHNHHPTYMRGGKPPASCE